MNVDKANTQHEDNSAEKGNDKLHIFINKIKFDENDGVKPKMTGSELADLVSVPRDNAKITRQRGNLSVAITDTVDIKMADHFEIIRKIVQAGYHGK